MNNAQSTARFAALARLLMLLSLLTLAGCGNKPRAPEWQLNARGALERYEQAFLTGDNRVAASEFARARAELAATGQPGLVARAELTRCALQVASLVFEPCAGFELLRRDAPVAERAYADYLAGRLGPQDSGLLPQQHRAVLGATGATGATGGAEAALRNGNNVAIKRELG